MGKVHLNGHEWPIARPMVENILDRIYGDLYGDGNPDNPGLVKEAQRREGVLSFVKWVVGFIGVGVFAQIVITFMGIGRHGVTQKDIQDLLNQQQQQFEQFEQQQRNHPTYYYRDHGKWHEAPQDDAQIPSPY